jgi:2-polyprenyl-3-methyl-5-hydroxy-6-metoxy-1,4-benzoquinol methylase
MHGRKPGNRPWEKEERATMNESELRQALGRYAFYHIIQLTDTISTPGYPAYVPAQNLCMKHLKSLNVRGKRVLDIGCRDGLFSFAAESMGATEVVGIDNDLSKGATELLIPFFNSKVRMHQMNLYDLKPESFGLFDVVIFPGVLYHLRYPFWGLRAIREVMKTDGHLLIETPIWEGERNNAMLFCPIEGDSPYEGTSCTFFNEKGLVDTLKSLGFQAVHMELLHETTASATLRSCMKQFITCMRTCFKAADRPPIKQVTRCVVHSTFSAFDKDTFTARYWETTHDFHTSHGGC